MAGVLQSTLLADEDQSLSLGEPHLKSHQGATSGGIILCHFLSPALQAGWLRK